MKTWEFKDGIWHECPRGVHLCSLEPVWLGDRQITMAMLAKNGYRYIQRYAAARGITACIYEKDEMNTLAPDFVALVSATQHNHIILLPALPDLMDWLARYRPCFQEATLPLECGYSTDGEATEADNEL